MKIKKLYKKFNLLILDFWILKNIVTKKNFFKI